MMCRAVQLIYFLKVFTLIRFECAEISKRESEKTWFRHGWTGRLHIYLLLSFMFRRLQHWILERIELEQKNQNISLTYYVITRWDRFFTRLFPVNVCHFLQTVKTLYLPNNRICQGGAQHLANALQNNKVRQHFY
jgi:hypothetical protein